MRTHFIGVAKTLRLLTQLPLKASQPAFPMSLVGLALAPFLGHEVESKLVGVELLRRLGDPRSLLFEQVGQRPRFFLAAFHQLRSYSHQSLGGDLFQRRDEVGDILGRQGLDASDGRARRFPRVAQRGFELIQRFLLALSPNGRSGLRSRSDSVQIAVMGMTSSCRRAAPAPKMARRPISTRRGCAPGP
jgi:hypothetical protein